jgi:hypothetical protein
LEQVQQGVYCPLQYSFAYVAEREKQKVEEKSHLPMLLGREKQKVIMGQLEEIKRETTYCMRHFISVSYKFKRQ